MKQLTALKPNLLKKPIHSVPMTGFKDTSVNSTSAYKALMNAEITNKLWDIDSLDYLNQ